MRALLATSACTSISSPICAAGFRATSLRMEAAGSSPICGSTGTPRRLTVSSRWIRAMARDLRCCWKRWRTSARRSSRRAGPRTCCTTITHRPSQKIILAASASVLAMERPSRGTEARVSNAVPGGRACKCSTFRGASPGFAARSQAGCVIPDIHGRVDRGRRPGNCAQGRSWGKDGPGTPRDLHRHRSCGSSDSLSGGYTRSSCWPC